MRTRLPILLLPLLLSAFLPAGKTAGPRIVFTNEVHDYGTIAFGSDGRCSFTFNNTGDAPLIIANFQSSCGCLVPYWDREPVFPSASGKVRLLYDTRRVGPFRKSAMLTTNDPERPQIVLSIRGEVLPMDTTPEPGTNGR
jgi:hypothetical protein